LVDFSNEDFLEALRQAQEGQRPQRPGTFNEFRQEEIYKSRNGGRQSSLSQYGPGFGLMGRLNTSSRAPTGPKNRPSGNPGVGYKSGADASWFGNKETMQFGVPTGPNQGRPSQYAGARSNQPPPWIDDVDLSSVWYSPMEPVWPFGPPNYTVPREWNFPVGYNLNYVPQRLELMGMLRGMRQSWGVLATVIESRKDQLLRLPWTVQVKGKPRANSAGVDAVKKFFKRPDGKLTYSQWTRKLLDDLFVIDAPTLFMDRDIGGKLRQAQVLDGGTIFPLIDDVGRRPDTEYRMGDDGIIYEHRQPAFQQIIYGLPMVNLSEDELMYAMMRPRPELPIFGFSQVEQIMTETTEAIRKTFYQLEFWRSGSMPEMIITVPDQWTPRQIATFQGHFDALLSGQLSLKSKVRFVPGGMKPFDIKNASGESLWSQRDELLVRLCCYAFSVSPTPFVHQSNRATANQSQETAEEEGLFQFMSYWKDDIMDTLIQDKLGFEDIEFTFLPRSEPDQSKQATIHQVQIDEGIRSRNDVRGELGLEPIDGGDVMTVKMGTAVVRLDQIISGEALIPGMAPSTPNDGSKDDKPPTKTGPSGHASKPVSGSPKVPTATNTGKEPRNPSPVHKALTADELDAAADEAERNPNYVERKIGNYKKGHISLHGLSITIENAKGSLRGEKDKNGISKPIKMPAAYGYIRGTVGADNMQVDCYLGKHPESLKVFVIDQDKYSPDGKDEGFDEHKVMLGYNKASKAIKDYLKSHYDGMGKDRLSAITFITYADFKKWLKKGDMKQPISEQGYGQVIGRRGKGNGVTKADTVSQSTGLLSYDQLTAKPKKKRKLKSGARWMFLVA
jgi:hypothetical protein